jgi:hypothetical protein
MTEPTEAMIKSEIAAAKAILREDKLIKSHGELRERLDKHFPDNSGDGGEGDPPKPPDPVPPKEKPSRRSIWWGEEKS